MDDKKTLIEDCFGEFGFRLVWSYTEYWVDVEAYEVVGVAETADGDILLYEAVDGEGEVTSIEMSEPYLSGYIKWDGCSELDQGRPHWCGWGGYQKHIDLLTLIYNRAFELMGRPKPEDDNG